MCESLVARDAGVPQRGILVAPECEHRLIHLLGIEHLQARTSRWKSITVRPVTVKNKSGSSLVITSWSVFSRKSVRYINAGMRVANLISFSCTSLRLDLYSFSCIGELLLLFLGQLLIFRLVL